MPTEAPTAPESSAATPRWQRVANTAAGAAILAWFAHNAAAWRFLSDDAFISFRYARNLADGHGLVWNVGEAVEGYTNFLWVLLMAAGMRAGIAPENLSQLLGVASGVAVLALLVARSASDLGWRQPLIWLAPAALATSRSFTAWSTSGLETQLFSLCVLAALLAVTAAERRGAAVPWLGSTLFGVATLVRPEGGIFLAAAGLCLGVQALRGRRTLWSCAAFAAPFAVLVGAHWIWRHAYYGAWLPNTFHAKVHGVWWEQGATYFGHFFADYQLHWFLPLALLPALARRRFEDAVWLTAILLYALYVFAVGGDRFEFRFLVVLLPLLYAMVADGLAVLLAVRPGRASQIAAVLAAVALVATTHWGSHRPEALPARDGIASIGVIEAYAARRMAEGKTLRKLVDDGVLPADLRVAVSGAGALPYYTMWPALDTYGLTDATIARQPVGERGIVAHEQSLPSGYLAERGIVVLDSSNRLVIGTRPHRVRLSLLRAAAEAKRIREADARVGLATPARAKCVQIREDRLMVFVTVVPEPVYRAALGHLPDCPAAITGARRPNVLLVVVDTLRADHLESYGHERATAPALTRLAGGAVRFDRAYAPASWTKPSVASIFTGQYPHRHGLNEMLDTLDGSAETLAEHLAAAGYRTAGVVSHDFLNRRNGFDQGFAAFDAAEARGHATLSTQGVTRRAGRWLAQLAADPAPFFLFVHYFDPHYAYRRHPEYAFAPESEGRLRGGEDIHALRAMAPELSADEVDFLARVYDEEIRATDAGIGELLATLDTSGAGRDTLVVITADHGEELLERGRLGHSQTLYEEVIRVPLIVRAPGEAAASGRVVAQPVSLVSIAPTILDYARVPVAPDAFQAPSLRPAVEGRGGELPPVRSEVRFLAVRRSDPTGREPAYKRALIDGRYKLIVDRVAKTRELYDLADDPDERVNLAAAEPERVRRMEAVLAETSYPETPPPRSLEDLDPADLEKLRALGYAED